MGRGWKRVGWAEKRIKPLGIKRAQETLAILIALFHQLPVLIDRHSSANRPQRRRQVSLPDSLEQTCQWRTNGSWQTAHTHIEANAAFAGIASEHALIGRKTICAHQANIEPYPFGHIGRVPGLNESATRAQDLGRLFHRTAYSRSNRKHAIISIHTDTQASKRDGSGIGPGNRRY